jgi:hypothetical protein
MSRNSRRKEKKRKWAERLVREVKKQATTTFCPRILFILSENLEDIEFLENFQRHLQEGVYRTVFSNFAEGPETLFDEEYDLVVIGATASDTLRVANLLNKIVNDKRGNPVIEVSFPNEPDFKEMIEVEELRKTLRSDNFTVDSWLRRAKPSDRN